MSPRHVPATVTELSRVPLLAELPGTRLTDLATRMDREELPPGTVVVREGEPGDRLYVLLSGMAQVVQQSLGERRVLRPGDTFGEVALAMDMPRTASVHAITPVSRPSCDRETFDEFLRPLFAEEEDRRRLGEDGVRERRPRRRRPVPERLVRQHPQGETRSGRPRGKCRCGRSARRSPASCRRLSSAGASRRGARTPAPSRSAHPAEGRRTPTRPELDGRSLGERLRRDDRRREQLMGEEREIGEGARERMRRRPFSELARDPERPEHGRGQVAVEGHLGALGHELAQPLEARVRVDATPTGLGQHGAVVGRWPEAWASRCRTVEPSGPAGSSRSMVPSSLATSAASAVSSFVTRPRDGRARRRRESRSSPRVRRPRPPRPPRATPRSGSGRARRRY